MQSLLAPLFTEVERERAPREFPFAQPLAFLLVAIFLLLPFWHGFKRPGAAMDEGALLLYPELILKGALPYRDFETFYGPGNPYLLAGAYGIFGTNIVVERAVGLSYRLLIASAFFFLARRRSTAIAAGCMAVSGFVLVSTGIAAQTWMGALACVLWSLWFVSNPNSGVRAAVGGFLASCALLFRQDLALAIFPATLPLFLCMPRAVRWKYLAGVVVGLLPFLTLLLAVGGQQFVNNLILYPIFRCNSARHLPLATAEQDLLFLFGLQIAASLVNLIAGVLAVRSNLQDRNARLLLALALLSLGMTHQAVQRIDLNHILSSAVIPFGLLGLSLVTLASLKWPRISRWWTAPLAIGVVWLLLYSVDPEMHNSFQIDSQITLGRPSRTLSFLERGHRSFPLGTRKLATEIGAMLDKIDRLSSPGQRLFVGPADLRRTNYNDTFLYHLMPTLQPASYFLEMNPRSANRPGSRLAADVASADWLILDRDFDAWDEPNDSSKFGSIAPNIVVRDQFRLAGVYGSYLLYRKAAL